MLGGNDMVKKRKGYTMSEGPSPKELRKLFETDALVCVDGCKSFEHEADKQIKNVLRLKEEGKISHKASEKICESILLKAKRKQKQSRMY